MSDTGVQSSQNGFSNDGNQYLTFKLREEEYGIEILRVQEIKGFSRITPLPNTPSYLKGVLNLRGTVVPIVDLRTKFSLPETAYDRFTVIIVVTVGKKVVGLVVDAVSDVLNIVPDEVAAAPELGAGIDTSFMTGMAKAGDKLITLLNVEKLVNHEELAVTESAA
ncbi:MAG TPA: chemotaxis protein CheW [Gemmataceae bacterium]|nr:chemotaxis protein CheW [Gemmataceae bacterium]